MLEFGQDARSLLGRFQGRYTANVESLIKQYRGGFFPGEREYGSPTDVEPAPVPATPEALAERVGLVALAYAAEMIEANSRTQAYELQRIVEEIARQLRDLERRR